MKKELNLAIKSMTRIGEIELFREMAKQFNHNNIAKCTYVKEVHKKSVEFKSTISARNEIRELGDLLFFTYDKSNKELRICVLQAKYKKSSYRKFLNCLGDVYQWDLLYYKPDVYSKYIPKNILNFRHDFKSITAYGVFYHDKTLNELDFLYTLPDLFYPKNIINPKSRAFSFNCPNSCKSCCGNGGACCKKIGATKDETLYTCSIDIFEKEILSCRIGAPIDDENIKKYALSLLSLMCVDSDNPELIEEILRAYDFNKDIHNEFEFSNGSHPAAIIVVTESEQYLQK